MPSTTRALSAILTGIAIAGCSATVAVDPATVDAAYLNVLEAEGLRTGNSRYEREQAQQLCNLLSSGFTSDQADLHLTLTYSHLTTPTEVVAYKNAATAAYCPEHSQS